MIRFATAAVFLCACGSTPTPVPAPRAPIEAAAPPPAPVAPSPLEPVDAPGQLVMHVRWRQPSATLAAMEKLLGPGAMPVGDVVGLLFERLEGAEGVDPERLRDAIELDAPADVIAVSTAPDKAPLVVASVGLRSVKAGLAAFDGEVRRGDGTWIAYGPETVAVESPPDTPADVDPFDADLTEEPEAPPTCVIAPGLGSAPARMICGADGDAVRTLALFAARNVAAMPTLEDDLRIDFSVGQVMAQWARELEQGWPEARAQLTEQEVGDAKLAAVLRRVGDDVVAQGSRVLGELDRVTVAANVGDRGLDVVLELGLAGRRSLLGRMLADAAEHEGPPPALMGRLPSDFSSADFGRTGSRAAVAPALAALRDVLAAALDAEKLGSPSDRKAWLALLRDNASPHVDFVNAAGAFSTAASSAPPTASSWWLHGIEQSADPMAAWLRDAVRAYNRPAVRRIVRDKLDADLARNLPRVRLVPAAAPFKARVVIDLPKSLTTPVTGSASNAGGGSPSLGAGIPSRYECLVMADGDRTWTGLSSDGAALKKLMLKLSSSQSKAQTPSTNAATQRVLAALSGREVTHVSVTTVRGIMEEMDPFVSLLATTMGTAGPPWWTQAALPHGGVSPILTVVDATGGEHPSVRVSLELPRSALEDFAFLGKHVGRAMGAAISSGLGAALGVPGAVPPPPPPAIP